MTFADLLCELIAEQGDLEIDEARQVFERYRNEFPSANCLDLEINAEERVLLLDFYRQRQHSRQWIDSILKRHRRSQRSAGRARKAADGLSTETSADDARVVDAHGRSRVY